MTPFSTVTNSKLCHIISNGPHVLAWSGLITGIKHQASWCWLVLTESLLCKVRVLYSSWLNNIKYLTCEQHPCSFEGLKTANHPEAPNNYCLPYHHINNSEKSISFKIEINKNHAVENCTNYTKNCWDIPQFY